MKKTQMMATMTRDEFKTRCECYNGDDFIGYYISDTMLDKIAQENNIADEDGNHIVKEIELFFHCQLIYNSKSTAFGENKVEFLNLEE